MDKQNKKMKVFLSVLRVIEVLYLLTFFFVIFAQQALNDVAIHDSIVMLSKIWINTSYMVLPVLLFKNVLVAILNNGILSHKAKLFILVRCAIYVVLTIYAYPLILAL
ncbi:MAG: hypothetical protein HZA80_02550 [Candidatus Taylorbacteria bacterium]|nr:hypothetical protein [Candidatus Taylorbacteria bacterium]